VIDVRIAHRRCARDFVRLACLSVLLCVAAACNRTSGNEQRPTTSVSPTAADIRAPFSPGAWVTSSHGVISVHDAAGTVFHPSDAKRIVSVAPNATEILFALGAGDRVVGVTTNCNYPAEAASREKVGDFNLNFEKIVALEADLVVGTDASTDGARDVLTMSNVPYFAVSKRSLSEILESIHALGVLLGRTEDSERITQEWNAAVQASNSRVPIAGRVSVFWIQWHDPLSTIGVGNFHHDLIERAGGVNIAADLGSAYGPFSEEAALVRDPQVILVPSREMADWVSTRLRVTRAVMEGRVHVFSSDASARAGPRIVDALNDLSRLLYPPSS